MPRLRSIWKVLQDYRLAVGSVVAVGVLLLITPIGAPLARLSYDLPFLFKETILRTNLVLVYADQSTLRDLGRMPDGTLHYSAHTRLLDRLRKAGAKAILYDFVFANTNMASFTNLNASLTDELAAAMRQCSNLVLGASYDQSIENGVATERVDGPIEVFRTAATNWGLITFDRVDPDNGVRRLTTGISHFSCASWVVAKLLNAPVTQEPNSLIKERWLNYYGPSGPRVFEMRSFQRCLESNETPDSFFAGKVVVVGARWAIASPGKLRDEFANPYSRFSHDQVAFANSPGYEVHATALLNLIEGRWLTKMGIGWQLVIALFWGVLVSVFFLLHGRRRAFLIALSAALLLTLVSVIIQASGGIWWSWIVPVWFQTFAAWFLLVLINPLSIGPPLAFISYRRDGSSETARLIRAALSNQRINTFLDVENLGAGSFPKQLEKEIENAPNFILILAPGALDRCGETGDLLSHEIECALASGRNIVPVLQPGFTFPPRERIPHSLAELSHFQAVQYSHQHFESSISTLLEYLTKPAQRKRRFAVVHLIKRTLIRWFPENPP